MQAASTLSTVHKIGSALLDAVTGAARWLRPHAEARPPAQRTVLDDITMRRPWNLRVKAARLAARLRVSRLAPGVTVVVVTWNTGDITLDVVAAVQRLSPPATRLLVVDNGSTDGTQATLRRLRGVDTMVLRSNAGHGVALDLGVCAVRTRVAVTLDSDALPLSTAWLDPAVMPVASGHAVLAGTRSRRDFVHPMYLAVDVATFIRRELSFQVHRLPSSTPGAEGWGADTWDTGEWMSMQLDARDIVFVEKTANPVSGLKGMTVGGVVYHHGGISRNGGGAVADDALREWRESCHALGLDTAVTHD